MQFYLRGDILMGMISEFKDFAVKGNLVDMAVGFIMGGAFATVVSSLVNDVIMPVVGKFMGGIDFAQLYVNLTDTDYASLAAAEEAGAAVIKYGAFINAVIAFTVVALVMFFIIKGMNKAKKAEEEAPAAPPANEVLLAEIRDLLSKS